MVTLSPERFAGKTLIAVGGAGGVGSAVVARALDEGGRVVIFDLDPTISPYFEDERVLGIAVNVADEESVRAGVAEALAWSPRIDSLLFLVGAIGGGPIDSVTTEAWNRLLSINSTGAFLCAREILPHFVENGGGSVVTISSVSAQVAGIGADVAYKVAKAGLMQLTRTIAVDYAAHGVRANCILPGPIATGFGRGGRIAATDELGTKSGKVPPLGRRATPEEIASATLYLASDDASYITGVNLPVDGGFLAI